MRFLIIVLTLGVVTPAWAEEPDEPLRKATITFAIAAIADGATTYKSLSDNSGMVEYNPAVSWMGRKPVAVVATGAAIEITAVWLWKKYVGKRHPKLAKYGLFIGAAVHGTLAVNNMRVNRRELNKKRSF